MPVHAVARVAIDTEAPVIAVNPRLFGGFIEHFATQLYGGLYDPGSPLADEQGFRLDVIEALRQLRLSIVRWPGGCFASGYHWRDGVGRHRRPVADPVWGVTDPNTFGTDEFLAWCERVDCTPYICTNAGNGSPEEMRDWVAYCRRGGAARVRLWSIGNENWGAHEIGARTPATWAPLVRRCAQLMQAAAPGLELVAAATADREWTLPLLRGAGEYLRYVAIHEYWLPCWAENLTPGYLDCLAHANGPAATLARVLAVLDEAGLRGRLQVAFDEWNLRGWHHPGFPRRQVGDANDPEAAALIAARQRNDLPAQYTLADALFAASFLNACLRCGEDVGMANIAPVVNTRGPLFVHRQGLVRRTTYHVLQLYATQLGPYVAPAAVASPPLPPPAAAVAAVDALATRAAGGPGWRLVLANRHPAASLPVRVTVGGVPVQGRCRATLLDGDSPDACNSLASPHRVAPRLAVVPFEAGQAWLPPHCLAVIEVEGEHLQTAVAGRS